MALGNINIKFKFKWWGLPVVMLHIGWLDLFHIKPGFISEKIIASSIEVTKA